MGSPLGPSLANLFLGHLEKDWLIHSFSPSFYARYIDDIFCIFSSESYSEFLNFLNSQHPNLKFTMEVGNKKLSFLDSSISIENNLFSSTVFRKPTFTGLFLNFHALCPDFWKRGLIFCLLNRAYRTCSSWTNFHCEIDILKDFFCKKWLSCNFFC